MGYKGVFVSRKCFPDGIIWSNALHFSGSGAGGSSNYDFKAFVDRFSTLEEVSQEIKKQGIEHCSLIFGMHLHVINQGPVA